MRERPHVDYIDGLRAVAVLSVLAYHSFLGDGRPQPERIVCLARGVDLFFVISGFCLAFPMLIQKGGFRPDVSTYAAFQLRRFSRIAPPFYLALAIFALLSFTSFGFPGAAGIGLDRHPVREFFTDLAFLMPPVPLYNSAFWTLGIEARWYLLCPLLVALYLRSRWVFFGLGAALYGVYFLTAYGIADMGTLPSFMAGIVAADVVLRGQRWRKYAWMGAAAALALGIHTSNGDHGDPIWHLAGFFLVVAGSTPVLSRVLTWRPLVAVGLASYSIYLYHAPFVTWLEQKGVTPVLAAVSAACIGWIAWAVLERPLASNGFRRTLEALLTAPLRRRPHSSPHPEAA